VNKNINIFEELNKMKGLIVAKPGTVISEQQKTPSGYDLSRTQTPKIGCVTFPSGQSYVDVKTKSNYALRLYNNGTFEQISDKNKGSWNCNASDKCAIDFKFDSHQSTGVSMSFTETLVPCSANSGKSNVSGGVTTPRNYGSMVADGSKKIQTSLGISPTGQLTDNDLQKVLSTLNGETPQAGNQTPQGLPTTADGQLDLQKILTYL
jgi:hypothetical protein